MPKHRRFTFEFTIIFLINKYQNLQTITKFFFKQTEGTFQYSESNKGERMQMK